MFDVEVVSIAGAILWGVLRFSGEAHSQTAVVSIAGAILWGVLPPQHGGRGLELFVSIAGAILWGVLRIIPLCAAFRL